VDACHAGDANAVRWNPACGDMLATAGDDGVVRVWRVSS
jgi:WD40 repeat protein